MYSIYFMVRLNLLDSTGVDVKLEVISAFDLEVLVAKPSPSLAACACITHLVMFMQVSSSCFSIHTVIRGKVSFHDVQVDPASLGTQLHDANKDQQ